MPYTNLPQSQWGKMDRCVKSVMRDGKGKAVAIAICYSQIAGGGVRRKESYTPPASVRAAAKRGLALRRKFGRGGLTNTEASAQGIGSGVQRASNLVNGDAISLDTIKRMRAFFARHEGNKNTPPEEGNGKIAWLLWGGDAGKAWVKSILAKLKHFGPGAHPKSGSPQRAHAGARAGGKNSRSSKSALSVAFGQDPNRRYEMRNRVVSLDDLITSNTETGAINPAYSQELQPRQRDRAASQMQIDRTAKDMVAEALVTDFHQLDKGAPIIGDDLMVESGNGRTLALMRAKEKYPEKWAEYQEALKRNLAANGLTEKDLDGVKNPVLVRERVSKVDRAEFAREANSAPVLQMSPLEMAMVDAKRIKDSSIEAFSVGDDQTIDQALRSAANRSFVRSFIGSMPPNEAAGLMRGDGSLNQMGLWRIKSALFSRTFPGEAGKRLSETFIESLDSNIKNFEGAISATMPKVGRAESLMQSGKRPRLSLADDFSRSLDMLARLKESKINVDDYLGQSSMFGKELTPRQEVILKHFSDISRSPRQIRDFFDRYADAVLKLHDPAQGSMFGGADIDEDGLLRSILK